ncbi:hypothetical protein EXE58_11185 [Nocardioides seonyuensis]|uniref:PqqD family peptide modification chaperone n=1 Tax=Nocardioides seonyuensis TaxID=2518371 RepID=A0A4P7IGT1_9ACTN|nr:hypothetical protein [Nocardioides seonyuensis]QBX55970.1 hypothetical protein EXE58_11185 [Nocardioides seonyuensis]
MDLEMTFDEFDSGLPPVVVRAMGVVVSIPVVDEDAGARLRHQWSRALTDDPVETRLVVALDGLEDPRDHDYAVTTRVTLAALEVTAGQRMSLHAGAVANEAGQALALVCASGGGKTTATTALAEKLGYLSDETVSMELDDLTIHPHPKPLSVCTDEKLPTGRSRKLSISPDDANLAPTPESARLGRIVLLRRDGSDVGLVPLTTAEAIVEIVPQTSSLVLLDSPLLTLARIIDTCGGAFALHYGEIREHVDTLTDLLASDLPASPAPVHHPPAETRSPVGAEWSRVAWADAVQYDDQLVVLIGDNAHLLTGLGTTLWLALAQSETLDNLVAVAVEAHGPHPEAEALVTTALDELADNGLVVRPGG